MEVSQSVGVAVADGLTEDEEEELADILDACELYCFAPETARVFENAIERLWIFSSCVNTIINWIIKCLINTVPILKGKQTILIYRRHNSPLVLRLIFPIM